MLFAMICSTGLKGVFVLWGMRFITDLTFDILFHCSGFYFCVGLGHVLSMHEQILQICCALKALMHFSCTLHHILYSINITKTSLLQFFSTVYLPYSPDNPCAKFEAQEDIKWVIGILWAWFVWGKKICSKSVHDLTVLKMWWYVPSFSFAQNA